MSIARSAVGAPGLVAAPSVSRRVASILGGSIGNLIEWYDFHVYVAFSLIFARQFFPHEAPAAQALNTAAIFALGFLLRPLGSWILGVYADKRGRRAALTLSVLMMCGGSLLIGLCPTYAQIGVAAPAALLVARLVQGISLGGEYGSSAVYLSEIADSRHRGFFSSFNYVTLIGGQLLATLVLLVLQQWLLSPAQLASWGWRVPFLIGAACSLIAFRLRWRIAETDQFRAEAARHPDHSPTRELLRHPRQALLVAGMTVGGTTAFFTYTVYMHRFLVGSVGLTRDQTTFVSSATLALFALLQPAMGALSDRIGRKPLLLWFGVLGTLCTVPILSAMTRTHDAWTAFALLMAALVIVSGYTAVNSVAKAELFPAGARTLGVGLPYAIATSVFGGSAEYVGLWFKHAGHETWFYVYVSACIACTMLTTLAMREPRTHSAIDRDEVAVAEGRA